MNLENFSIPDNLLPSDPRFGSGPSLVPTQYVQELAETGVHLLGTSHRQTPIKNLCKGIQEGLKEYFKLPDDYSVVLGNGGATFLFDMIGLGMVEKKITHFTCGEFSQKWFKSSKAIPWIEADEVAVEYGQGIDGKNVEGSDVIAITLNETSTGVQITGLPEVDDQTILAVDATSGAGQCPCDVSKVDLFFLSPQKVFASEGGLFVAIISPKARARALRMAEDKTRYVPPIMNWKTAITNSDKNQTYNTPSVATLFFLNKQVAAMNALGYDKVQEMAKKKADLVYGWAQEKPYLSCFIKDEQYRSQAVATIDVDESLPVEPLINLLAEKKIAYGIDAYRKLGRNQFRIALFHNISYEDLDKLLKILSMALEG